MSRMDVESNESVLVYGRFAISSRGKGISGRNDELQHPKMVWAPGGWMSEMTSWIYINGIDNVNKSGH